MKLKTLQARQTEFESMLTAVAVGIDKLVNEHGLDRDALLKRAIEYFENSLSLKHITFFVKSDSPTEQRSRERI